jgi:hypothetical protein
MTHICGEVAAAHIYVCVRYTSSFGVTERGGCCAHICGHICGRGSCAQTCVLVQKYKHWRGASSRWGCGTHICGIWGRGSCAQMCRLRYVFEDITDVSEKISDVSEKTYLICLLVQKYKYWRRESSRGGYCTHVWEDTSEPYLSAAEICLICLIWVSETVSRHVWENITDVSEETHLSHISAQLRYVFSLIWCRGSSLRCCAEICLQSHMRQRQQSEKCLLSDCYIHAALTCFLVEKYKYWRRERELARRLLHSSMSAHTAVYMLHCTTCLLVQEYKYWRRERWRGGCCAQICLRINYMRLLYTHAALTCLLVQKYKYWRRESSRGGCCTQACVRNGRPRGFFPTVERESELSFFWNALSPHTLVAFWQLNAQPSGAQRFTSMSFFPTRY